MELTDFFGMQIFSIYEGENIGTVFGATFNKELTKIKSFKVFDSEENEFELLITNIKNMSDCILITNKSKLSSPAFYNSSPLQKSVYNEHGKSLGKIINAEVDKNGNIVNFLTDTTKIEPKYMYNRKDFIYYSLKKIVMSKIKPKSIPILNSEITVRILNFKDDKSIVPIKATFNPSNLIGKTIKNDILGKNNEMIAKANQVINEQMIADATMHNRLNELFYNAV